MPERKGKCLCSQRPTILPFLRVFEACSGIWLWPWSELHCRRWIRDFSSFFFFFNYPRGWPPLDPQPTPAVRLNSLVVFPSSPQSICLFCIVKLFCALLSVCVFTQKWSVSFNTFSAIKWPRNPGRKKSVPYLRKSNQIMKLLIKSIYLCSAWFSFWRMNSKLLFISNKLCCLFWG